MRPATQADAALARARRLLSDHRTRAKRDGAVLDYSLADVRRLLETATCCAYCSMPIAWDASLDHRQPVARGGKHGLANLAVCCARCNAAKGLLTETEFRALRELLAGWQPAAAADVERRLLAGGRRYEARRRKNSTFP